MNCCSASKSLSAHLDRALPADRQRAVEQHLAQCADCRRELAVLEADRSLLRSAPSPELPPYMATRTLAEIRRLDTAVRRPAWRPAFTLMASVLVTLVGLWFGSVVGRALAEPLPKNVILDVTNGELDPFLEENP